MWFTAEAIASWKAEARTTRGGQPAYSGLAILTALTLRAVFRLALRQTEGLIGSVIGLLGLDLAVPDHSTRSQRAATVEVPRPRTNSGAGPFHLLVDSTGLKLCGAGEWLHEKHGAKVRRSWRKLHLGLNAGTGRIVASLLTNRDVDDGSQVGPLLDRIDGPLASFTGDGAYDQEGVTASTGSRHPDAAVMVPPRSTAVPSDTAETAPTQHDRHLRAMAEHGRMVWQAASGYTKRARAETTMSRFKRLIGDALRPHADERRTTEVDIVVHVPQPHVGPGTPELRPHHLNRDRGWRHRVHPADPCNNASRVSAAGRPGASLSTFRPVTATAAALSLSGRCGAKPRRRSQPRPGLGRRGTLSRKKPIHRSRNLRGAALIHIPKRRQARREQIGRDTHS